MPKHLDIFERGAAPETEPLTTILGTTKTVHAAPELAQARRVRGSLSGRALTLGLLLVAVIAALTPYNDYVLRNSPLIGNHFPIAIVTVMAALVLLVNPLLRLAGRAPFRQGELVTVMSLLLIGAAVPSSGLMRYLEPLVLGQFYPLSMSSNGRFEAFTQLMPSWLTPSTDPNSSIIRDYFDGFDARRGGATPIVAFLLPALFWLILAGAVIAGAMYLSAIFRKQWVHHERLSYPLAIIPLELFAEPEPGKFYNATWRSGMFWAGALIPIMVCAFNGLHSIYPAMPEIKLAFDFGASFRDHPWDQVPSYIYSSKLYLSVVGICFFIPSEIALSLWLFLFVNALLRVPFGSAGIDVSQNEPARGMGIYIAYFVALVWLARSHLRHVLRSALQNAPAEDGEYGTYRGMLLGLAISLVVAWAWLVIVGMQWWAAVLILGLGTVMVTLMSRVVAESGLFFVSPNWWAGSFFSALTSHKVVTTASFYWGQIVSRLFYADLRETAMPYATNILRMNGRDSAVHQVDRPKLMKWLFAALAISTLTAAVSHHTLSYNYARNVGFEDRWASEQIPMGALSETERFVSNGHTSLSQAWTHFGLGAAMVTTLMVGRAMFVGWPFHPIGLLLMNAGPMQAFWFSILVGWGIKQAMLRYGGAIVFRRARPFFIGLIVGELMSAGVWVFVGLLSRGEVTFRLFPG